MKKFLLKTIMTFSIIFIFLFSATMLIEYRNKDKLKEKVNVEVSINKDGGIEIPNTPAKVEANYEFSKFYFYSSLILSIGTPILFYKYGGIEVIKKKNFKKKFIEGGALCIMYSLFSEILMFPKILFSSFYRGRLVGLKHYNFSTFIKQYLTDGIIGSIIGILVLIGLYLIFIKKKRWNIIIAILAILFNLGSNFIYPYIDEVENKLIKMEDCELRDKILDLAKESGIENLDIRVVEKSNETNSMNAYMTGIGSSRRIVFWDTTLKGMSEDEILSVAAHEMGHYKLNHINKSMILGSIGIIILCIAIDIIMKKIKGSNYRKIDNIPIMLVILSLLSLVSTPIETWYSRKIEIEADTFAMEVTNDGYTNGALEIRFINSNLTPIDVSPLYKWLNYDHPTAKERIELSNKFINENKKPAK